MRQRAGAQALRPGSVGDMRMASAGRSPNADAADEAAELLAELKDAQVWPGHSAAMIRDRDEAMRWSSHRQKCLGIHI